jgi:alpha-glucosidase
VLGTGFSGYIADISGFLPSDAVLYDKSDISSARNRWPVLWAGINREVVDSLSDSRDIALVIGSGYTGAASYATLAQTGACRAVWGAGGGLKAALNASLSLAWSGYGVSYSMAGGAPRSLFTFDGRELMMRWAEFAAFTPVMHAAFGGRTRGVCVDEDIETLRHFSRMAAIHEKLSPYLYACSAENAKTGVPVMRPLDMAFYMEMREPYAEGEYMLGPDLLVAPVIFKGRRERSVVFPKGTWINLWSGKEYREGRAQVPAPLGKPPVFFPTDSKFHDFFLGLKSSNS